VAALRYGLQVFPQDLYLRIKGNHEGSQCMYFPSYKMHPSKNFTSFQFCWLTRFMNQPVRRRDVAENYYASLYFRSMTLIRRKMEFLFVLNDSFFRPYVTAGLGSSFWNPGWVLSQGSSHDVITLACTHLFSFTKGNGWDHSTYRHLEYGMSRF
jgi:hypothetical protein